MYRIGQCKECGQCTGIDQCAEVVSVKSGQCTGIDQCTEVVSVKSVVNVLGLIIVQKWSV